MLLCATFASAFVGLVYDRVHEIVPPKEHSDPERWVEIVASETSAPKVENSFTGHYLQVLPDDQDDYSNMISQESFTQTYIRYDIFVEKPGTHTLFLRWSGGDSVGGGDSLYTVIVDSNGNFVPGLATVREATQSIGASPYAGCCYDGSLTHRCVCAENEDTCESPNVWVTKEDADQFGARCPAGRGQVERVLAPQWYEYAGGNIMNFDTEPWDVGCEAEGTGPADSGRDAAQWNLENGYYELRIYAREDGTAFEAFYLAGPNSAPPSLDLKLAAGVSTTCPTVHSEEVVKKKTSIEYSDMAILYGFGLGILCVAILSLLLIYLYYRYFNQNSSTPTSSSASTYIEMGTNDGASTALA